MGLLQDILRVLVVWWACFFAYSDAAYSQPASNVAPETRLSQSHVNESPGFEIQFPSDWKVFQATKKDLVLRRTGPAAQCGIGWYALYEDYFKGFDRARASKEFAFLEREQWISKVTHLHGGVRPVTTDEASHKRPDGLAVFEFHDELGTGVKGKSVKWYIAVGFTGFRLDCETYLPEFELLLPSFLAIMRSFAPR